MLGDSVTFGHGSVYETTYPRLLEERLRRWRPDVDWQVWNAAVPGYNTSQELAHLLEVGGRFQPDLVIVGFFENDLIGNRPYGRPTLTAGGRSASRGLSRGSTSIRSSSTNASTTKRRGGCRRPTNIDGGSSTLARTMPRRPPRRTPRIGKTRR